MTRRIICGLKKLIVVVSACCIYLSAGAQTYPYVSIQGSNNAGDLGYGLFGLGNVGLGLTSIHGGISFWTGNGGGTTPYESMRIWRGYIGIGTASPQSRLHVVGGGLTVGSNAIPMNSDGAVSLGNTAVDYTPSTNNWTGEGSTLLLNGADHTSISFHDSGSRVDFIRSGGGLIQLGFNGGWGEANIGLPGNGIWNSSGNVGIGTTQPDTRLAVNGTVHATEVKVDLTVPGPDYVFDSSYRLADLKDLKSYVTVHHHLPEVPSAAEMAANGLKLGEMNALLLKKIEELTLHLISQDERLQSQQRLDEKTAREKKLEDRLALLERKLNTGVK
ncbi:hypothetical protein GS399_05390 [Pedobacter sp. HMF7647]|uniref:BZIP transcription factor n=1 Tax=Hufsiella arboris TaxID=2695275 RepID=A0A7K1Y8J2_9SPHI|nr:hypothetical protein [Hufsiella arboris]MXV50399.1 hypothetical protein [Hufsiella arboris]